MVKPWLLRAGLAICVLGISGCAVSTATYSVSGKNIETLRGVPQKLKLGQFTGSQESVSCRLQPISPEDRGGFASFIRKAFNEEMSIAGVYSNEARIELRGDLKVIDVDCGTVSAGWTIEMQMTIGDQPPFTVKTVRSFPGNFFGAIVFRNADSALVPTVQDFVKAVLDHPSFQSAVRQR